MHNATTSQQCSEQDRNQTPVPSHALAGLLNFAQLVLTRSAVDVRECLILCSQEAAADGTQKQSNGDNCQTRRFTKNLAQPSVKRKVVSCNTCEPHSHVRKRKTSGLGVLSFIGVTLAEIQSPSQSRPNSCTVMTTSFMDCRHTSARAG